MPRVTPPDTPPDETLTRSMKRHRDTPSDTSSQDLQAQLAEAEKRAAVAEAELRGTRNLVDEKQRTIDAQAHALRLLEPPRSEQSVPRSNFMPLKETPMQHSWKIAAGFLIAGIAIIWLRSSMTISDAFAVPAILLCTIGFSVFVITGSLLRKPQ